MAISKDKLGRWGGLGGRLPARQQAVPVFGTVVFFVFTWALYRMFYEVPSWLYYLSLEKILPLVAYVLAYALFESLLLMGLVLFLCLVYPVRFFKDRFAPQGTALVILLSGGAVLVQRQIGRLIQLDLTALLAAPLLALAAVLVTVLLLSVLLDRLPIAGRALNAIADRMSIFAYVYVPLGMAGWVVVLVRNWL